MAKIKQIKNPENKQHRLDSKKKFRRKIQLFKIFRIIEFILITAIAIKVLK